MQHEREKGGSLNKEKVTRNFYLLYIKTGSLPTYQDSLISKKKSERWLATDLEQKLEKMNVIEHLEFTYSPKNVGIALKKRIPYLENLRIQKVNVWIAQVQEIIREAQWVEEDAIIIINALIRIPYKKNFENYSCLSQIFDDLQKHFYPEENLYEYQDQLKRLHLKNFQWLDEYIEKIKQCLSDLACCMKLSKKQIEEKFDEIFISGLSVEVRIEMSRHKVLKVSDMIESIISTEKIIKQHMRKNLETSNTRIENSFNPNKTKITGSEYKKIFNRWCRHCKSKTHDTEYCYKLKKPKDDRESTQNSSLKPIKDDIDKKKPTKKFIIKSNEMAGLIEIPVCPIKENVVASKKYTAVFDTGSEYNYINKKIVERENLFIQKIPKFTMISAVGETTIEEKAEFYFQFDQAGKRFSEEFFITEKDNFELVLGNVFFIKHSCVYDFSARTISISNLILPMSGYKEESLQEDSSVKIVDRFCYASKKMEVLEKINDLNADSKIGCLEGQEFRIVLNDTTEIQKDQYLVPLKFREGVKTLLKDLKNQKIIRYSHSNYSSPAFVIEKPNKELRLVVDYRLLNNITKKMVYPFPDLHDQLLELKDSKYFSQLDLKSGFYHIKIAEEDKHKTSFVLLNEQYEFERMPMGLTNSPRFFQMCIARLFKECEFVKVFVDDLLVFSENLEKHYEHLNKVLSILKKNNLTVRVDKSRFALTELVYLGFKISEKGIFPNMEKLDKIAKYINPKNKKDVMKLLGFINWFRPFVGNLSEKLVNLTNLLKKETKFEFTQILKDEILTIFQEISKKGFLNFPDLNKEFYLQCDASNSGLGSVLFQESGVVGYFSYKLKDYETRYTIVEKEMYCIYLSLKYFRKIIFGTLIKIFTDNKNNSYVNKDMSSRIARWQVLINEYEPIVSYLKGESNLCADFLSRMFAMKKKAKLSIRLAAMIKDLKEEKSSLNESTKLQNLIKTVHKKFGHPGVEKMYLTLRHIKIKNLKKVCSTIAKECFKCKINKSGTKFGFIKGTLSGKNTWETVSSDIVGPYFCDNFKFKKEKRKFWIITFTDTFSRFSRVKIIFDLTTKTVLKAFTSIWINKYPVPKYFVSDQGKAYLGNELKQFLREKGITQILNKPYNPEGNGISERINKDINFILRVNKGNKIGLAIKQIHRKLNFLYHSSIKMSPIELVDNYNKMFQLQSQLNLEEKINIVKSNNVKQNDKNLKKMNRKRKNHTYRVDDLILVKNESLEKLADLFCGPYVIKEIRNKGNGFLVHDEGNNIFKTVNIKNIKPLVERGDCHDSKTL